MGGTWGPGYRATRSVFLLPVWLDVKAFDARRVRVHVEKRAPRTAWGRGCVHKIFVVISSRYVSHHPTHSASGVCQYRRQRKESWQHWRMEDFSRPASHLCFTPAGPPHPSRAQTRSELALGLPVQRTSTATLKMPNEFKVMLLRSKVKMLNSIVIYNHQFWSLVWFLIKSGLIQIELEILFQYKKKTGNKSKTWSTEMFKLGVMPFSDQDHYSRLVKLHYMNQRIHLWSLSG